LSRAIGFDNRALAGQKLIGQLHQEVVQIVSRLSEKLNPKRPEQLSGKLLRGIASIDEDFSIRMLMKVRENRYKFAQALFSTVLQAVAQKH